MNRFFRRNYKSLSEIDDLSKPPPKPLLAGFFKANTKQKMFPKRVKSLASFDINREESETRNLLNKEKESIYSNLYIDSSVKNEEGKKLYDFETDMKNTNLWNLPVDNQEHINVEHNESFRKHIFINYDKQKFLDKGIVDDAVHNYMELVIEALRYNPHMRLGWKRKRIDIIEEFFLNNYQA